MLAIAMAGCAAGQDEWWAQGDRPRPPQTLKDRRDLNVIKQREDYSCGAAALATLLNYYYGDPVTEKELLTRLQAGLTEEERQSKIRRGFSLLDLKRVAQERGYRAAGFRLTASQVALLAAPAIVFVEPLGYKHFAVIRGVDRGRVYLADPARGNIRMGLSQFLGEWSGIVFVLGREGEERIASYPLQVPHPDYVQPEILRFSGQYDLGMMTRTLPLR
jgi:predicted double-glycine peptidase